MYTIVLFPKIADNHSLVTLKIIIHALHKIMLRVTGRGRIGADGLAFWYTAAKGIIFIT